MRRSVSAVLVTAFAVGGLLVGAGPVAAAAPADTASTQATCTLTVGDVYYSANMLYASARLSGDCYGQVDVELQKAASPSGPFETVASGVTYPLTSTAQGGTAWFDDAYGCGYYRAVGTYADLTAQSPRALWNC